MIDVDLDENFDIGESTSHIAGEDLAVQRLEIRLRLFRTEYVLDERVGVPWLDWLTQKRLDIPEVRAFLSDYIEATPGIRSLSQFRLSQDGETLEGSGDLRFESGVTSEMEFVFSPSGGNTHPFMLMIR
ncbi:MAG: hypothetical protein ABEN55_12105 [Bradymonadaceae bacterium]